MEIPNGASVPNPCVPNTTWPGVGHQASGGAGPRNPFGIAFEANGEVWGVALCQMDSDGDGKTNGQELGDPNCTWTKGSQPSRTSGLSHPGVCEPLGDPKCATTNSWLNCTPPVACSDFNLPTTQSIELRFPNTSVPSKFTTYICLGFLLPNDTDYQIIGMRPIIDNANILHHGVLYGCDRPVTEQEIQSPSECPMLIKGCRNMILAWTVGLKEICYPSQYGLKMGPHGVQYALLQLHWSNFGDKTGLMDSSGFQMFYTSKLRQYDGVNLQVNQYNITIPPNTPSMAVKGVCSSGCSSKLADAKLKIAGAFLHMHLLGISGNITLKHNGQTQTLISEDSYDYNSPRLTFFDQQIDFQAGDEIYVTCVYNSSNKNITTVFGEQTSDEMCLGVILTYPAVPGFIECSSFIHLDVCTLDPSMTYPNCSVQVFQQNLGMAAQVCDQSCSQTCKDTIVNAKKTGCLEGNVGSYIRNMWPHDSSMTAVILQGMDFCAQMIVSEGTSGAVTSSMSPGSSTLQGGNSGLSATSSSLSSQSISVGASSKAPSTPVSSSGQLTTSGATTMKQSAGSVSVTQPSTAAQSPAQGPGGPSPTQGPGGQSSPGTNNGGQSTWSQPGSGMSTTKGSGGAGGGTGKLIWAIPVLVIVVVLSVSAVVMTYLFCFLPAARRTFMGPHNAPNRMRFVRYQ